MTKVCTQYADRVLIRPSYQYKDLLKLSLEKQQNYRRQGIRPGSKVLLCEHNSINLLSKLHALWELSAVPCLVPHRLTEDKRKECETIVRNETNNDDDRFGSVDALVMFTSGTSANTPKGVRLSHTNLCMHTQMIQEHVPSKMLTQDDRSFSFLPWTHCYGLMGECFTIMNRGASMGILSPQPSFSFPRFYRELQLTQPTVLFVVPYLLELILERDKLVRQFIPNPRIRRGLWFGTKLRMIVSGGAALRPQVRRAYWETLEIPVYQGYGCTEMSPMVALQTDFDVDDTSVGTLLPDIQWQLRNDDELWVNGPNRFVGYLASPSLPYPTFHNTKDRARVDETTQKLWITGRSSDVVKLKNGRFMNVQDIESTIKDTIPYALDVCVWQQQPSGDFVGVVHVRNGFKTFQPRRVQIFSEDILLLCRTEPFKKMGDGTMTMKGEMCRPFIQSTFDQEFPPHQNLHP